MGGGNEAPGDRHRCRAEATTGESEALACPPRLTACVWTSIVPSFRRFFSAWSRAELKQVVAALRRLRELDWNTLYRHTGFRWEAIEHLKAPNDAKVYSLRLSQRICALAFRDGDFCD